MPVTEPEKLWAVLDQDSTVYAAAHPRACHEHINDAIDNDVQDAGKMVVREYVSLKAHNEELTRLRAEVASLTAQLQSGESFHAVAVRQRDAAWAEVEALRADAERLTGERDVAIGMLAYWCVAVDHNGTGWDDWDEHYKDAMYRPCLIRELLDSAIDAARTAQGLTKPK